MAISYIENINNHDSIETLTWKKLHQLDVSVSKPFQLMLADSETPLICTEIIRIVPKKRLVAFGKWNNQAVVAKLFYERGKKSALHCQRDAKGVAALIEANVPTPALKCRSHADKKRVHVLLFEKISPSFSLEEIWQGKVCLNELLPLLRGVIHELATQHVLGILQRDLHLKNFLVSQKKIYTLDGGSIEKFDMPLDKKASLDNLGLFFAQLGVGTEKLRQELFQYYVQLRSWLVKKSDITTLHTAINKTNQQRWQHFQKKIFRNCTAFKKITQFSRSIMVDRTALSPEFLNLLNHPEQAFTEKSTTLKAGRSSSVVKIKIQHQTFVVKRYNVKNSWHWLRRCLRPTRAAVAWRLAQRLRLFGVATPKPIAYIENHLLGLRGKSYLIMEAIEGVHLGDYFTSFDASQAHFSKTAEQVVKLFQHLAELFITHGDLKMTNILIGGSGPFLIDLDGMIEHTSRTPFKRALKKDLRRFLKNWQYQPSIHALFDNIIKLQFNF